MRNPERIHYLIAFLFFLVLLIPGCLGSGSDGESDCPRFCDDSEECCEDQTCYQGRCRYVCDEDDDCENNYYCSFGVCLRESSDDPSDGDSEAPLTDGDFTDGDVLDGDVTDGDTTDGDTDIPQPECTGNADCSRGKICIQGSCVTGCLNDRDCPAERYCNTALGDHGQCVECLNNDQCSGGKVCYQNSCVLRCEADGDCNSTPDTPYCDPNVRLCVECVADNHCALGSICFNSNCVDGCRGDRDCQAPLVCDPEFGIAGTCVECVSDVHCDNARVCSNHECVIDCGLISCPLEQPYCDPQTGACVPCLEKAHCRQGELCIENECISGCDSDADCSRGEHCKPDGYGICVECFQDSHCASGQVCVSGTCRTQDNACDSDSDCAGGQYCHPNLRECKALPSSSCNSNEDCGIWSGQVCDPYTRSCIPACLFDTVICILSPDRLWCIDGGCYECREDADCLTNTPCDPFDQMCILCSSDADCSDAGDHCDTDSGSCYECLRDSHCAQGEICDPDRNRCVECLSDDDCTDPTKPDCGKNYTCIPPCRDECAEGEIQCNSGDSSVPISYFECGDTDNDYCLEYDEYTPISCPSGQTCTNDACVCIEEECDIGDAYCGESDNRLRYECASDENGCRYWAGESCASSTICAEGECVCEVYCSQMDKRCIPGDPDHFEVCQPNSFTGCMYWAYRTCGSGTQCVGENVCSY